MSAMLKQKLIDIANGFTKYGLWKGGSNLSELDDVTLTNLQTNDVLTYNGSEWVNDNIRITDLLMQGDYAVDNDVDILNLSIYKTLTFIVVWDNAQFLNCITIPIEAYNSFYGGLLRLDVVGGNYIEIRPVSNTKIHLKCSSTYLKLRVFGTK